jgi:hypothetical protein
LIKKKDEDGGFAFVKQSEMEDASMLNLVSRRQIGHETSTVLFVLRHILEEFDSNPTETQSFEKFITDTEIKEEIELFLPERYDRVKLVKDLDKHIEKVVKKGFLKEISKKDNETKYQIHKIIKEKITLDDLQDFKNKLEENVDAESV